MGRSWKRVTRNLSFASAIAVYMAETLSMTDFFLSDDPRAFVPTQASACTVAELWRAFGGPSADQRIYGRP